jgi:hypothetical protein
VKRPRKRASLDAWLSEVDGLLATLSDPSGTAGGSGVQAEETKTSSADARSIVESFRNLLSQVNR